MLMCLAAYYRRLFNFLSFLLYHSFSWSYDLIAWLVSFGQWQHWIKASLPYLVGPKILEVGFGTGHLLQSINNKGVRVFGIDESSQMCIRVKRKLNKFVINGYAHCISLLRGETQALPFPSRTFNTVVSTFPSNYILDPHTVHEISRVMLPEGKIVIVLSATLIGKGIADKLLSHLFWHKSQPFDFEGIFLNNLSKENISGRFLWIDLPPSKICLLIGNKMVTNTSTNSHLD